MSDGLRTAVVTIVSGRHRHLAAHRRALARSVRPAQLHVVVSMDDPDAATVARDAAEAPTVEHVALPAAGELPLAAARNAGARAALAAGAQLLVFLDVDCLAGADLLTRYGAAARQRPDAVLCGPVTYLPAHAGDEWTDAELHAVRRPHPARPDPPPGDLKDADVDLFWSLSFAVTAETWPRIGGFDESYHGYGAEDTDFGRSAATAGVPMLWVGGADAYHQHHPSSIPPVQHVDAVLRNGALFASKWGEWPMRGWLTGFAELGLVRREGRDSWRRADPLRVVTVPARHPYVDVVRPAVVRSMHDDRVVRWAPDPLLDPAELRRRRQDIDLVHVHFGYEHLSLAATSRWLETVAALALPLVVTVHDLHNPHRLDNAHHDAQLRLLLAAADHVLTLTGSAAARIAASYGRDAEVVPHPTLLADRVPSPSTGEARRTVLVPLGALRANVTEPAALVAAVVDGAARADAGVTVTVRPHVADDPRLNPVRELADDGRLDLVPTPWEPDRTVLARVAAAHALVLPYAFGTHSGWLELARDTGTHVVAPDHGAYADQSGAERPVFGYRYEAERGLCPASLAAAVADVLKAPAAEPADAAARGAQRALVRAQHEIVYRRVLAR